MAAQLVARIVRTYLEIRREQRADEIAEADVRRRRVIQRANRQRQQPIGDVRAFFGDALGWKTIVAREPKRPETVLVGRQESAEDGGHEQLAAIVLLEILGGVLQSLRRLQLHRTPQRRAVDT